MDQGIILVSIIALVISYFIFYLIIKGAVTEAVEKRMKLLQIYKLAELKRQGISTADIEKAKAYLDASEKIHKDGDKERLEEWWLRNDDSAFVLEQEPKKINMEIG